MKYIVLPGLFLLIAFLPSTRSSSSKVEASATTQNREAVQRLYGSPVREVYQASKNLTVTASFASNGELCRANIGSNAQAGITDKELEAVLDKLAPKEARGKYKMGTFLDVVCVKLDSTEKKIIEDPCAECSGVSEDYERVGITKYGNTDQYSSVHVTFKKDECKE